MLNIILLGPPGSGKGTQAELLSQKFALRHISPGELLRQAMLQQSPLGIKAKAAMDAGQLVEDQLIIELVVNNIQNIDLTQQHGLLIDGFPRNLSQARALEENKVAINYVIYLKIADQLIVERLAGRRYHPGSGRIYHVKYDPPKIPNIDNNSGEPLITRTDDLPETIYKRLQVYHQNTAPIVAWYRAQTALKFIEIDGSLPKSEIFKEILVKI